MPRAMYVGCKAKKEDNVAWSGVVWLGHGDIQDVSDEVWAKLAPYPDVWIEVPAEPAAEATGGLADAPAAQEEAPDLYSMNTAALREYATGKGYALDLTLKGQALRNAIQAAGG